MPSLAPLSAASRAGNCAMIAGRSVSDNAIQRAISSSERPQPSRLPRRRSAHGKNGPNSLRRGLIFDVQSVVALGKLLFTLVAWALH
jgi:hypothetical protein